MIVFKALYRCFLLLKWGKYSNYLHGNKTTYMRLFIDFFFQYYNSIFNLCHFSMTPLCTITQHINDAPYTTSAKRGLKIEARAYCRNVISGRGLFRLDLNRPIRIAEGPICAERIYGTRLLRNISSLTIYFTFISGFIDVFQVTFILLRTLLL